MTKAKKTADDKRELRRRIQSLGARLKLPISRAAFEETLAGLHTAELRLWYYNSPR